MIIRGSSGRSTRFPEARPCDWSKHCGAKKRTQSASIMQGEIKGIVNNGLLALYANIGGNGLGKSEQHQRMIDQVRGEIHEHPSSCTGALTPGVGLQMRPKTIVVRFKS